MLICLKMSPKTLQLLGGLVFFLITVENRPYYSFFYKSRVVHLNYSTGLEFIARTVCYLFVKSIVLCVFGRF